jgi:hypothetical protein
MTPAGWPAGGRSWFVAAVSLVLATNVLFSRHLFPDSFYDLYAGRYIAEHGIVRRNVFTVASHGASWIDQQWLAHVLYYGAWAAGGYPALAAFSAVLVTAGFAVLALLMLRQAIPPPRMFAWTLAAFVACLGNTLLRAQSFAYLFLALTLWMILEDDRAPRPRARTWLLIPVLLLWANTHGSALLGAGLVVLHAGCQIAKSLRRRDLRAALAYLALGIAASTALLGTPYGTGVIWYYRRFLGNPALAHVAEWQPPSLMSPSSWGFFGLALATAVCVIVAWRRGTRPDPLLLSIAAVLLALGLTAVRDQAWFGFGASVLAADTLARSSSGQAPVLAKAFRRGTAGIFAALALVSLGVLAATATSQFEGLIPRRAINAAASLAARNPGERILGDDWSAAAMLWLHPAMLGRIGFDIRVEQYSQAELSTYFRFLYSQGASGQQVMRGYGLVFIARRPRPQLGAALERLPSWRVVYQDRNGLVLQRQVPA